MEKPTEVTITVPVGGPVWAAWMLTQGKTIETSDSLGRYRIAEDSLAVANEHMEETACRIPLSSFMVENNWREYKPPQEPQDWAWAFAEMQAGRVVVFDGDLLVKLGAAGGFVRKQRGMVNWGNCALYPEMFIGKKWTSADES